MRYPLQARCSDSLRLVDDLFEESINLKKVDVLIQILISLPLVTSDLDINI